MRAEHMTGDIWLRFLLTIVLGSLGLAGGVFAQNPQPTLLYDVGHNNQPPDGAIASLLELVRSLDVEVRIEQGLLTQELLATGQVLVIADAMSITRDEFFDRFSGRPGPILADWPMYWTADTRRSAFTSGEIHSVVEWVRSGGSLLLIVDHAPSGAAASELARALGTDVRDGFTWDGLYSPPGYTAGSPAFRKASYIYFARGNGMIGNHRITDELGEINAVATYVGTSVVGPVGSTTLLALSDSALDYHRAWEDGPEHWLSAAGRGQAVAYLFGQGRVVVIAEVGALMKDPFGTEHRRDPDKLGMGLDYLKADNRRFARNVLVWLLEETQNQPERN